MQWSERLVSCIAGLKLNLVRRRWSGPEIFSASTKDRTLELVMMR